MQFQELFVVCGNCLHSIYMFWDSGTRVTFRTELLWSRLYSQKQGGETPLGERETCRTTMSIQLHEPDSLEMTGINQNTPVAIN